MKIEEAAYTHIGYRPENEDCFRCEVRGDQFVYAVVADGLGGHGGGGTASGIAVKYFSQCGQCRELPSEDQINQWMCGSNAEILANHTDACNMKTTVVFLAVSNDLAIWAHVGDSRLYHFHNGKLKDFTRDHSVPQVQVYSGELTRDQIPASPDRNKLLRALGNVDLQPEIHSPVRLSPGRHAFLLCSDGFWEYLSDTEIWLDLLKSSSPEEWLMYLRCRGEMRKGTNVDNNTAVAVFADV